MSEPEFPLCAKDDPRVPVVYDMLRKSQLMGGNFTLDARRILAALDEWGVRQICAALEVPPDAPENLATASTTSTHEPGCDPRQTGCCSCAGEAQEGSR